MRTWRRTRYSTILSTIIRTKSDTPARRQYGRKQGKNLPPLSEQLNRNEDKPKEAWKVHEESASTLCNLLDEIITGGWKDLYPLVMAALQWEVDRATGEPDVYCNFQKWRRTWCLRLTRRRASVCRAACLGTSSQRERKSMLNVGSLVHWIRLEPTKQGRCRGTPQTAGTVAMVVVRGRVRVCVQRKTR
jgi:hypothetical protein